VQSFYSYALNRKNSAYVYSGLALRLSVTLGLHRNITYSPTMSPVDVENRRRVWWTVYTFDRLCSSKLGHPIMIKDEDIDAPLPSSNDLSPEEREDFVDAEQLIANIKLSRITGSILDLIYAIPVHREQGFVRNVHRILTALKEWDATLPVGLKLNHEKMPPYSSRSVASLRLHFNQVSDSRNGRAPQLSSFPANRVQCIILTTRPILLYVFKHHVKRTNSPGATSPSVSISSPTATHSPSSPAKPLSPMTIALSEACIYAARASNRLLGQLWADGSIATFGYWDAHYLFSSMIVLLMSNTLNPNPSDADAVALAWNLIQSMVDDGNLPAREFCERLVSLQRDLDELTQSDALRTMRPEKGYVAGAGEFAAPVVPGLPYAGGAMGSLRHGSMPNGASAGLAGDVGAKVLSPAGVGGITPGASHSGALDDPFIRDFLGQPDSEWSPGMLDMSNEELGTWSLAWDTGHLFQGMGNLP
jgi:proline utilization trans-activator